MPYSELSEVSTRDDLAAALTRARESAGLSIRALARTLQVPPSTIGGYFGGRHLPPPGELQRLLRACNVGDDDLPAWLDAARRVRASVDRRITGGRVPYQGLEPFDEDAADLFHGREEVTERIAGLVLGGTRLVAVVGPSGSGKSSILRAGLAPRLRREGLACTVLTPGANPGAALAATLSEDPDVLVVDQFEEVFTLAAPASRARFLARLASTGVRVVIGLRADFYSVAADEDTLLAALQSTQVLVGPMSEQDMRAAITAPATAVGAQVEDALVDLLLAELRPHRRSENGALPLLSHAMLACWERSRSGRLTVADYRATGGVDGAVQRTAEDLYAGLEPAQQVATRRIFLRLVTVEGDVAVTRRLLSWDELDPLDGSGQGLEIVGRFVDRRLLTAGADHVEISHEALLTAWPRLAAWVRDDRAVLRLQRQISEAANDWYEHDRDPSLLWRGVRLDAASELRADPVRNAELTAREREFADAGTAWSLHEMTREQRRANRLRTLLAVSVVLLLVAVALGVYAQRSRLSAESAQRAAALARDDALSRQVAVTAVQLRQTNPALAEQLILAAYDIAPTSVARGAMIDASASSVQTRILGHPGPTPLALSHDGRLLAVADAVDGSIRLYRNARGQSPTLLGRIAGPHPAQQQVALAFSPDGRTLASGGQDQRVRLWSVGTPARPVAIATLTTGFTDSVQCIAFSPDGHTVVASSAGPRPVQAWDVHDLGAIRAIAAPGGIAEDTAIESVAFDRLGRLAAGGSGGTIYLWPRISGGRPVTFAGGSDTVEAVAFDPGRAVLYAGDVGGNTRMWSLGSTPSVAATIADSSNSAVDSIAVSPDGSRVAVGVTADTVSQWLTARPTASPITVTPGGGPVTGLAYSPDSAFLFVANADGSVRIRSSSRSGIPVTGVALNLAYDRTSTRLAVFTNDGVSVWNPRTEQPSGPPLRMPDADGSGAMNAAGSLIVAGDLRGRIMVWDTSDPTRPRVDAGPIPVATQKVESIAIARAGTVLAVASDDGSITVLDLRNPHAPRTLAVVHGQGHLLSVAFSRTGRLLAGASTDRSVYVWDVSDSARPKQVAHLSGVFLDAVDGVTFSPTEDILAAASSDETVRLWDLSVPARPTRVGPLRVGPTDYVYATAFSPDGSQLAAASNDRTVRIYRVHSGADAVPDLTLQQPNAPVRAVVFSADGKTLTSGGRDATLSNWSLDPSVFAHELCQAAGDPITPNEWALYVPGAKYDPPCR